MTSRTAAGPINSRPPSKNTCHAEPPHPVVFGHTHQNHPQEADGKDRRQPEKHKPE